MVAREPPGSDASAGHVHSALRGLRWIGTTRIFVQLVSWGLTVFTVRLLEPRDYGIVATAGLFTIFAQMLLDGGLGIILISERDLPVRLQGAAAGAIFAGSLALAALIVAIAPLGGMLFRTPALTLVLRVASLQLPLWALIVVPSALLSREMKFRESALTQSLASVVQGVATLTMAYAGDAYWSLIFGTMIGAATRAATQWMILRDRPTPNLSFGLLGPLWRKGTHMVSQRVLYFVTTDFDTFMLGRFWGPGVLGPYSLAKSLSHTALDQMAAVVNQVSVPTFAKIDNLSAQVSGLRLVISMAAAVVFPLFWLMAVLSRLALPLLFGSRWTSLVIPFMAFAFVLPLRSIYALVDSAVLGTGHVSTTLKNMLTWTAILVPLLLVGSRFGAHGAAAAWVVALPIVFVLSMRRIARVFEARIGLLLEPLVSPAICAAASCIAVEMIALEMAHRVHPVAQLAIEIAVGAACYGVLMRSFARSHYDRVLWFVGRLINR